MHYSDLHQTISNQLYSGSVLYADVSEMLPALHIPAPLLPASGPITETLHRCRDNQEPQLLPLSLFAEEPADHKGGPAPDRSTVKE